MGDLTTDFESELTVLINKYNWEHVSNTPDWVLAQYLMGCMNTFNQATQQRETWYGPNPRPTEARKENG